MTRPHSSRGIVLPEYIRTLPIIRPILFIRLIFGYYCNLGFSYQVQIILKCYCIVMPILGMFLKLYYNDSKQFVTYLKLVLHLMQYAIACFTENKYVNEYYFSIPIVDDVLESRKIYMKLNKMLFFTPIESIFQVILVTTTYNLFRGKFNAVFVASYIVFGRLDLVLIFSLFYCRVRVFRKVLSLSNNKKLLWNKNNYNNYLLMYTEICKSLDKISLILNIRISGLVLLWFANLLHFCVIIITVLENNERFQDKLICGIIFEALEALIVFFPSIMQELVNVEIDKSKIFVSNQLLTCTDEKTRSEMQKLLNHMRNLPARCDVWGFISMRASLPFVLFTVLSDIVICLLQYKSTFFQNFATVNVTKA